MTRKDSDPVLLLSQSIDVLVQNTNAFVVAAKTANADHETRLRALETVTLELKSLIVKLDADIETRMATLTGKMNTEIGVINTRVNGLGLAQAALTTIASTIAAMVGLKK